MLKLQKQNTGYLVLCVLFMAGCSKLNKEQASEKTGTGLYVYQLEQGKVTTDSFNARVQELSPGQKPEKSFFSTNENGEFTYVDDKQNVYFFQDPQTGNLTFNAGIQKYLGAFRPELPDAEGAVRISEEYLQKYRLHPKNKEEVKLLHSGGLRADSGPKGEVIDKMLTLTYGRVIDKIPVLGSGSRIVVNIGDKGEVTGLTHKWREVNYEGRKEVTEAELIPEKEAEAEIRKVISEEFGKDAEYKVEDLKLVYYDGDGRYIQPVYAVKAVVRIKMNEKESSEVPYLTYVHALKKPAEDLRIREELKGATEFLKKPDLRGAIRNKREDVD